MSSRIRGRRIIAVYLAALLPILGLLAGTASADELQEVQHTDNVDVIDREVFPYGTDIAFDGDLAVAGSANWTGGEQGGKDSGIYMFKRNRDGTLDRLGFANCSAYHADVDFVGRKYVVQSHDDGDANRGCQPGVGKEGVRVFDVRNPRKPRSIGFAETLHGAHNLTAVGDTGLVYIGSYNLGDPAAADGVSIVDVAANPADPPVTFLEFPDADQRPEYKNMRNESGEVPASIGCHDIGLDLKRDLAFCAGISETQIWDISDPRNPVIIEIIYNPDISIHHGAQANVDGDVLYVQDEWAGAAGGPSGCAAPKQPSGTIWAYDISDPRNPTPLGFWSAPEPDPAADFCTTHFFGTFEMNGRDMVVTSYYDHGVWVVDFSNPSQPTTHAFYEPDGATFWSAYAWRGKLYANSFAPATLTGSNPANADKGGLWVFKLDGYDASDPTNTP